MSLISLGLPLLALAQALTSCGSDDDGGGGECEPGTVRACPVPGQSCTDGTQTCSESGTYSACACGGSGTAGAGGTGGGGGGGSPNGGAAGNGGNVTALYPDGSRPIGAPCEADADCPAAPDGSRPLTCIESSSTDVFGSGGPQGGYCTAPCEASPTADDCQALDSLSICGLQGNGGATFCLGVCLAGGDTPICSAGLRAQACVDFQSAANPGIGGCFPFCQNDAACGDGFYCDLGVTGPGLCTPTTTAPVGAGIIGAPCTTATETADCLSGICLAFTDPDTQVTEGFCSANCTFGILPGCGFATQEPQGAREAACLLPQLQNGTTDDIGYCLELCDENADCEQDGFVCVTDLGAAAQAQLGRLGNCVPPVLLGGVGADAGVGDVDAGN